MAIGYSHATVRCGDVTASAAFYRDVLGFEVNPLDGFEFEIQEVSSAGHMFLHLVQVGEGLDRLLGRNGWHVRGRAALLSNLEHLSLAGDDPAEAQALAGRLQMAGLPFVDRTLEQLGVRQFLLDDPNGIELELSFPLS